MASRTPRVTSRRRQPTTRGGPVVSRRQQQPTTGRGRVVRQPPPRAASGVPAAAQGPTASAVAPTPYSLTNLPPDANWLQTLELLQRQRDENVAAVAGERTRTLSDYGFHEGPTGALTFDPNNPFSKAAVLKQTFDTSRRSTGQSMASGGQLYSGAAQNAQDLIGRNQLQAQDAQLKALQAFLASNTGRRKEALTGYETAAAQADADRAARFLENPLYDPAASPEPAPAAAPAAAAGGGRQTKIAVSAKLGGRWVYEKRGNKWVPIRRTF